MNDTTLSFEPEASSSTPPSKRRPGRIAAVLLAVALFGIVIAARLERRASAMRVAAEAATAKPLVSTAKSAPAAEVTELTLPGNTEAVVVSDIYARAVGYVKARYVDIGDHVKAGKLLAEIESPELDQQLAQARATVEESRAAWRQAQANVARADEAVVEARARLEQAQANESLAAATAERWSRLVNKGVLPRQEGDERSYAYNARTAEVSAAQAGIRTAQAAANAARATAVAAEASIRSQEANVARLERMVAFERVVAPFDGIITERSVEQGDLVTAGGLSGGRKLFAIAQPSMLRVQVNVPQTFTPDIKLGQQAQLSVRERPGLTVTGRVARTANALNAASRTLLVEVQVDNKQGALLPGMFAEVKFALPRSHPAVLIPAESLITSAQGTRVAIVDQHGKLRFRAVEVARDLGTQIEIASDLETNQSVVLNPGETLTDGQEVEVAAPANQKN